MPEGHTIHRLAREHRALLVGRPVGVQSPQGRFTAGAALLDGSAVTRIDPYGKHLWYRFEGDQLLHVHLGLYGRWTGGLLPAPDPRGALRVRLTTDEAWLDLRGPTQCELATPGERTAVLARLGPDPLRPDADPGLAWARLSRSRTTIGQLLMDQSVLAGSGFDPEHSTRRAAVASVVLLGVPDRPDHIARAVVSAEHLVRADVQRGDDDRVTEREHLADEVLQRPPGALGQPPERVG
ncbi:MAG: Formamidopyrimidine-DNA glycosylase [Frankiales bacterium]|nr:Formamidopyrimidine-DNA glycosylase [Frankiales bacterium]